jgi:hypothetical protein
MTRATVSLPKDPYGAKVNRTGWGRAGWGEIVARVTRMTVAEAVEYFGSLAADLATFDRQDRTLRELMVFAAVHSFLERPNPMLWQTMMEREEGKVPQTIQGQVAVDWRSTASRLGVSEEEVLKELEEMVSQQAKQLTAGEEQPVDEPDNDQPND